MMSNSIVYEKLLKLCQSHDDLTVTAGNKCPGPCPECLAYWKLNNKHSIIWIRRDISKDLFIWQNSDNTAVTVFVNGTSEQSGELSLLSHEYGHYSSGHDGRVKRDNVEDCRREFEIEVEAWDKGEQTLMSLGFEDWTVFNSWKKKSLDGYYDGFKQMFMNFEPIVKYARD